MTEKIIGPLVYKDKTGKILGPELFDGDWPFIAQPDLSGHEKLRAEIAARAAKARGQ